VLEFSFPKEWVAEMVFNNEIQNFVFSNQLEILKEKNSFVHN